MSTLFYVIGASGVGKDTLMNYARIAINGNAPVIFAHRYITRDTEAGNENHINISREEFALRKANQLFALDWESHGQCYGIGIEIDLWLQKGLNVVVNGSRQYLPIAKSRYPITVPVSEMISNFFLPYLSDNAPRIGAPKNCASG